MHSKIFTFEYGEIVITPFPSLMRSDIDNSIVTGILDSSFYLSATALPSYRVVIVNAGGNVELASSLNLDHAERVIGFSLNPSPGANSPLLVGTEGSLYNSAWNWSVGTPLFLLDNGLIGTTPLPEALFTIQVATAIGNSKILIDLEPPVFTTP